MSNNNFDFSKVRPPEIQVCPKCGVWLELDIHRMDWFCPGCGHVYEKAESDENDEEMQ